ncbi:unnamed protein product [Bemisia tabaci]|uniref:Spaetzle domain-containing protein n=1 Tax=Bemisia tabaci TaxID=7038 RepID=A0A9N9ZYY0_BEMTA|nr:unnamed protein product [Bemisia tabaci]
MKMLPEQIHRHVRQAVPTFFCVLLSLNLAMSRPQADVPASPREPAENLNVLMQKLSSKAARSLGSEGSPRFTPKAEDFADCANGSTFCETIKDYPSSHIDEMFMQEALKRQFDSKYEVEIQPVDVMDEPEKEPLCKSMKKLIYPNITKTDDVSGESKVYTMKSGIEVEECVQSGSCSSSEKMPAGFKALCKQRYVYTHLLMTDKEGVESKQVYLLPSGCICSLKAAESGLKIKDAALLLLNEFLTKPQ